MRLLMVATLIGLGACSEGGEKNSVKADQGASQLAAGQWLSTSEVTDMRKQDKGAPAMKADKGTRMEAKACVTEAEVKNPPPALLAGLDDSSCTYQNIYMARGRINASLTCTKPGLAGQLLVSADGTYTDKSFELTSTVNTVLPGDGDISFDSKVTGRHSGACTG